MRIVEVIAAAGHSETLQSLAEQHEAVDIWWGADMDDGRRCFHILVRDVNRQPIIDALQSLLGGSDNARILIMPLDAALPRLESEEEAQQRSANATREELYSRIELGARLDANYLLLVVLSTIVAAIGLIEDNVAVVVGAMVIAPLLGPNIALAFATSLGDSRLTLQAFKTNLSGMLLALGSAWIIGLVWPVNLQSLEILSRTDVGLDGVALALASGAAAVLSLSTGLSMALVGVMVAVALLPPTATLGMLLGSGQYSMAQGALLLLAVNVVCVILSAKLVFLLKGVKPRTWLEKSRARQSMALYLTLWASLLVALIAVILLRAPL